nr:MAG TPA: hypothetical protein [Bacteriophage sp.]
MALTEQQTEDYIYRCVFTLLYNVVHICNICFHSSSHLALRPIVNPCSKDLLCPLLSMFIYVFLHI